MCRCSPMTCMTSTASSAFLACLSTTSYREAMAKILLVSDATTVLDEFKSVLDDGINEIRELRSGELVRAAAVADPPDLVVTDCQVQNMGGIAICHDLKLEESGGRLPHIPVLIALDR